MNTPSPFSSSAAKQDGRPRVALIAGPTASGKSALAMAVAKRLEEEGKSAVIINADSAQVYADLTVLSARPQPHEMAAVDHRLYGHIDGAEACSAARWAADARTAIDSAHRRERVPILVGGTGLYLRTLVEGIAPIPEIDPDIRNEVRTLATAEAYAALRGEDPRRAAELNPADSSRIARALEIVRSTGRTIGEWQQRKTGGIGARIALTPLVLLPPRYWIYQRCDRRFTQMLDGGATHEVERLLARNLDPDLPVMRAIGVREVARLVRREAIRDETIAGGQMATRQYAKRQYTWFRNQSPDDWPRTESNISGDLVAQFASLL